MKKKHSAGYVLFMMFVCVASAVLLGFGFSLVWQSAAAASASLRISDAQCVPLRFMILGRSDDTISARLWFYDRDGRETGSMERSWKGWELFLSFIVTDFDGRCAVFPYKIYTDETGDNRTGGTFLFPCYDRDGMCEIYSTAYMNRKQRYAYKRLFTYARTTVCLPFPGKNVSVVSKMLRECRTGVVYAVYTDIGGVIDIRSE